MNQNGLSRLERLVRETVEGSFGRLFGGHLEPIDVATRLVQAMEDNEAGSDVALTYEVVVNPADFKQLLEQNPTLTKDLADAAWELGQRYGLKMAARPVILIRADENVRPHAVRVAQAKSESIVDVDTTQVIGRKPIEQSELASMQALDAFLVIQGKRHFSLTKPVVTIGRRQDNDIVLDSPSISRKHAQIRWRFGRFFVYDVSGRGRTRVNDQQVAERMLEPGDVIAISDAFLVYGEGNERPDLAGRDQGSTQVIPQN